MLPAKSLEDIVERLRGEGVFINIGQLQTSMYRIRKNPSKFGFTIGYFANHGEHRFVTYDMDRDGTFHTDPAFKASLFIGGKNGSKRAIRYVTNVGICLRAASDATYIPRSLKEDFAYYADKFDQEAKDIKRLFRKLDEFKADGTNGA